MANTNEPTRPIGQPTPAPDGTLRAKTTLSPKECRVRARLDVPPSKVMPIILVPGIMGSNLRASTKDGAPRNRELKPGESAWRPPNGINEGISEATKWEDRSPSTRQKILDGPTLEVDPSGAIDLPAAATIAGMNASLARERGWGEVHWSSYGTLLCALHSQFGQFLTCAATPFPSSNWHSLNLFDRRRWNGTKKGALAELEIAEIEKLAQYWYPVYAFGYNWLQSNEQSANSLRLHIEEIIAHWNTPELDCRQVVLVTHSMGGLVARACAKQIHDRIACVVHACMPALGAPVCYRRIACGTESSSPSNGMIQNAAADKFADIAGRTPAHTNPVMAHAPGALELLPTHLYPTPWLSVSPMSTGKQPRQSLAVPVQNIYDFYADILPWYRLFDPSLIDPAEQHRDQTIALQKMTRSVRQAKRFHESVLGVYFHQNTYALYGGDPKFLSYGRFIWKSTTPDSSVNVFGNGKCVERFRGGGRIIEFTPKDTNWFVPSLQDEAGDGTVPTKSAAGCKDVVKEVFSIEGFSHQDVFSHEHALALTLQLVAKGVAES
ncbi:PGAP1-like protein [Pseudoduganella flava]|nr:PGAP1-like protein [Pseudoduganella flava]